MLIYGKGTPALAEDLGVSEAQAQAKVDKFFASKPHVEAFINDTHEFVKQNGYVETAIGFRRSLEGINSSDKGTQSRADRQSVNTIIQGTGASLTNTALFLICDYLRANNLKSKLALTVHDSVLLDCPPEELPVVPQAVLTIMTNLPFKWLYIDYKGKLIRYPIDAEMEIGNNYNDMVDYDPEDAKSFSNLDEYINYYNTLGRLSDLYESKELEEDRYLEAKEKIEKLRP